MHTYMQAHTHTDIFICIYIHIYWMHYNDLTIIPSLEWWSSIVGDHSTMAFFHLHSGIFGEILLKKNRNCECEKKHFFKLGMVDGLFLGLPRYHLPNPIPNTPLGYPSRLVSECSYIWNIPRCIRLIVNPWSQHETPKGWLAKWLAY